MKTTFIFKLIHVLYLTFEISIIGQLKINEMKKWIC